MNKDMQQFLTGASLLLKAGIACVLLVATILAGYVAAYGGPLGAICFGPIALVFGIFLAATVIWMLDEIKQNA